MPTARLKHVPPPNETPTIRPHTFSCSRVPHFLFGTGHRPLTTDSGFRSNRSASRNCSGSVPFGPTSRWRAWGCRRLQLGNCAHRLGQDGWSLCIGTVSCLIDYGVSAQCRGEGRLASGGLQVGVGKRHQIFVHPARFKIDRYLTDKLAVRQALRTRTRTQHSPVNGSRNLKQPLDQGVRVKHRRNVAPLQHVLQRVVERRRKFLVAFHVFPHASHFVDVISAIFVFLLNKFVV